MSSCRITLFLVFSVCLACGGLAGQNWAILIQGSYGWYNYCSQASVCHAYQTLHKGGIPEENIVVMHYDDIAYNKQNPYPGTIINSPHGKDVYKGTPKDYTAKEITVETFLAALSGDEAQIIKLLGRKGKVINSTAEDNIFVFYSDHGADHFIVMPDGNPLHARRLNQTFTKMYEEKRYSRLVFFLESCLSGSMFENVLSPDINIYTMTASGPKEYAVMEFCDEKKFETCLGGEFSCNWLGDTDFSDRTKTSLNEEFEEVNKTMRGSTPHQYGDLSIGKDMLEEFLGERKESYENPKPQCRHPDMETVPINMARIFNIKARLRNAIPNSKLLAEIEQELADVEQMMANTKSLFLNVSRPFFKEMPDELLADQVFVKDYGHLENFDCYEEAVDTLFRMCPKLNPNSNPATAGKTGSLIRLCNQQRHIDVIESVIRASLNNPVCSSS